MNVVKALLEATPARSSRAELQGPVTALPVRFYRPGELLSISGFNPGQCTRVAGLLGTGHSLLNGYCGAYGRLPTAGLERDGNRRSGRCASWNGHIHLQ